MPTCVFLWVLRAELCRNACPHSSQMYGFSPVWIRKCDVRSFDCEKAFAQNLHLYGFSPVCVLCKRSFTYLFKVQFASLKQNRCYTIYLMPCQNTRSGKFHFTSVTFIWFFPRMNSFVFGKRTGGCEAMITNWAYKRSST